MNDGLEARYLAYLAVLNERRLDDLVHFVHDRLTYNEVSFAEHVFYRFDAGRIAAVTSLIDRWSIATQLRDRARPSR